MEYKLCFARISGVLEMVSLHFLQHVHFMPDPCMLSINGIVFGVTSTDVLFQLGSEEIAQ